MPSVRELPPGEEHRAARVLRILRPRFADDAAVVEAVVAQRPAGYRLLGSFPTGDGTDGDETDAVAVAGFREVLSLSWGRTVYVDDLVTAPAHRGEGHATALLGALDAIARVAGCGELHLDSGVGADRQAAHRRYFGHGMRVAAFHFSKPLS